MREKKLFLWIVLFFMNDKKPNVSLHSWVTIQSLSRLFCTFLKTILSFHIKLDSTESLTKNAFLI